MYEAEITGAKMEFVKAGKKLVLLDRHVFEKIKEFVHRCFDTVNTNKLAFVQSTCAFIIFKQVAESLYFLSQKFPAA